MRNILFGAVAGGSIAFVTAKIVEQFIYSYFRRPAPFAILIAFFSLLIVGFILYRGRQTRIPVKTILIFALALYVANILWDFIFGAAVNAYIDRVYGGGVTHLSNLENFKMALSYNLHLLIGGVFVGVITAVVVPFLQGYNLQNKLPFLAALAIILIYFASFGGFLVVNDTGGTFRIGGVPASGIVFGGMVIGIIIARQTQKAVQLTPMETT